MTEQRVAYGSAKTAAASINVARGTKASSVRFNRTFTYFFSPLNSTMSLVVVVRATARRFPSRDHAKDAT